MNTIMRGNLNIKMIRTLKTLVCVLTSFRVILTFLVSVDASSETEGRADQPIEALTQIIQHTNPGMDIVFILPQSNDCSFTPNDDFPFETTRPVSEMNTDGIGAFDISLSSEILRSSPVTSAIQAPELETTTAMGITEFETTSNSDRTFSADGSSLTASLFAHRLLMYIIHNRSSAVQDIRIAIISYNSSSSALTRDDISSGRNDTDICQVLRTIEFVEQQNEIANVVEDTTNSSNRILVNSLELAQHVLAVSEDDMRSRMVWLIYDARCLNNIEPNENITEASRAVNVLINHSIPVFTTGLEPTTELPESVVQSTLFHDIGVWMNLFQENSSSVYLPVLSSYCGRCSHDQRCSCELGGEHHVYSCLNCSQFGNLDCDTQSTMQTLPGATTPPTGLGRHSSTPTLDITTASNQGQTTEPVAISSMTPTSITTDAHFETRKPLLERQFFLVLVCSLSSVIFVTCVGAYCLTVVVCWQKNTVKTSDVSLQGDNSDVNLEEVYMEGYVVPVPSTGSGHGSTRSFASRRLSLFDTDLMLDENHIDMPGWDIYLEKQLRSHNLVHISISCFNPKRGAWTPGFEITERQIRDLERIYRKKVKPIKNWISLASNTYKLDKKGTKFGNGILHASRELSREEEHVWISFGMAYVVIGVSELDDSGSDRCLNCVLAIQMHIMASYPQRVENNEEAAPADNYSCNTNTTIRSSSSDRRLSNIHESHTPFPTNRKMRCACYTADERIPLPPPILAKQPNRKTWN